MAYVAKKQHEPIDPDVKVPAAIRAAALRSDALHKEAYEKPADETQKPTPEPTPEPAAGDPPPPEPAPTPEPGTEDDFKHKYNSLKGRYDRQEQIIGGLNNTVQQLQNELAQLRDRSAPTPANPDLTFKDLFTDEEREAYGEDFLKVAGRAASPQIAALQAKVDELSGKLGSVAQVTHQSSKERMYAFLDNALPTWHDLNRDQKFLAWVNLPDPFSGVIRVNMMRQAYDSFDGQRVLNFFNGFLSEEAATDPAKRPQPEDPNKGKIPLTEFAAPGRAKAPAASTPPGDKETISLSQIANFYALVQKGHYKGNEGEKDRLEQMIFAAQAEGRVIE